MGRYRDTGTVNDMRRSGCPKATTAVDNRYLWISAQRNPESNATMLNNAFCLATGHRDLTQLYEIGCMIPDVHGEVHIWHLDTMQRGTDGAQKHAEWTCQNRHQVLFTDECCMCLQPDNHRRCVWRQFGQAQRLRHTVQRVQQGGGSLMFWGGISGADICHWWSWRVLKRLYDTGMTSIDLYCNHICRISRGVSLNGWQFLPSSCTSCEWVPSWLQHRYTRVASMFSRHEPYHPQWQSVIWNKGGCIFSMTIDLY